MTDDTFQRIAKALADPHRINILQQLAEKDRLHCGAIVEQLSLAQATVSHHLKELVNAGLVVVQPAGQFNYYILNPDTLDAYTRELRGRLLPPATAKS